MTEITRILNNWSHESRTSRDRVIGDMYDELKRLAVIQVNRDGRQLDLQPTALVNEAYMRLIDISRMDLAGRRHFMGLAGRMMREILVDEARRAVAAKRGRALQTRLTGEHAGSDIPIPDLLVFNELLTELEKLDPVYAQLIDARAFAGLTFDEAAEQLELSVSTLKRKWRVATAWLSERLAETPGSA